MWNLIVSVPDHCLSFYFADIRAGCGTADIYIHVDRYTMGF